ncbi:MAG: hypothetical protein AB1393_05740 [Candidatus Edwardsbacteria bacterium]
MQANFSKEKDFFTIRTEWLKFKASLFDHNTGLPVLPLVLEEIRRLLEDRGQIGLIYLSFSKDGCIEAIYGWDVYDQAIREFARAIEQLKRKIFASEDILVILNVRGDEILLFISSTNTGDTVTEAYLEGLAEEIEIHLKSSMFSLYPEKIPQKIAIHRGVALIVRDPMIRMERCIYQGIEETKRIALYQIERREMKLLSFINPLFILTLLIFLGTKL